MGTRMINLSDNKTRAALCFGATLVLVIATVALRLFGVDFPVLQLAAALTASVLIYFGGAFLYLEKSGDGKIMRRTLIVIFAIYLVLLINFTIFNGHFGRVPTEEISNVSFSEYFEKRGNLVPFRMIWRQTKALFMGVYRFRFYAVNVLGNLAALAPCALFLPLFFKKCRKFPVFFLVTSAMIIAVEALQLVTRVGSFDVDDYILNIAGASIAFALLSTEKGRCFKERLMKPKFKTKDEQ